MKKTITFLLVAVFTTVLSAQTVSIQGGSSYGTITEAITAAVDGDVILITGTFTEPIAIGKSITLKGANPATDIIQAAASSGTGGTGLRVISIGAPAAAALNVKVENLTIRNGNASANGGGINVDKVTGLVNLNNLIITNNYTTTNGGAVGIAGSNVNITNCSIQNNTSLLDGGAIIAAPNNAAAIDNIVNIKQSLINANVARNGGGVYINGNLTFGNTYKIAVNIENSTVSNNTANNTSTASALAGGGAICSNSQAWTTNTAIGNVTLNLIHATLYGNLSPTAVRAGIQFNSAKATNFSAYNSIIVGTDDLTVTGPKAINFTNTNIINVVNCIFGGTTLPPTIVSDPVPNTNNNQAGKSAAHAGITGTLTSEGGSTQVFKLDTPANTAVDYCTVATGITIPTIDQRGYSRTGTYDAGAFELGGTSLGVNNFEKEITVDVFPNPASDILNVKSLNAISKVNIYDLTGKQVLQSDKVYNDSIDISNLSRGMHLLVIESEGQKFVKRIVFK